MTLVDGLDDIDNQDFSEQIPPEEGSVIFHLVRQVRPGMSLTNITLPTFILETRSTLERFCDWLAHADILRQIPNEPDAILRALHFCTWLVSGFHMGPRRPKKPYNSVLGEVFRARLKDREGNPIGLYFAEQVSHHPPVSAFHYSDRGGGVVVWGHVEMRSRFYGNSVAALMDHENTKVNLELTPLGETYEFNFPDLYGRGVFIGSLTSEICGTVRCSCMQTGVTAEIQFHPKPLVFGRYNRFDGKIVAGGRSQPLITFSGRWSAYMKATDVRTGREWLTFDVRTAQPLVLEVPPLTEQCEFESRLLWKFVTFYLEQNDTPHATCHKYALEEKQRKERQYQSDNQIDWELQLFHFNERRKRFVPNDLNLDPAFGEEPVEMPTFHVPAVVQRAYDAGITQPIAALHDAVEEEIRASP
jgi:hypothetical protein